MYEGIRVIDCCDERGIIAGQMLADTGADVIALEPPGGSPARRLPPFAGDHPGIERSLYWHAYARNKRSATLYWSTPDGRALLDGLLERSDALLLSGIENLAALGGYDALAAKFPRLVVCCVTPFGLDGPKAGYAGTDITILASSGALRMSGDRDRPPVRGGDVRAGAVHGNGVDDDGSRAAAVGSGDRGPVYLADDGAPNQSVLPRPLPHRH